MTISAKCSSRMIEFTEKQNDTILHLLVNLHWDLVREFLDNWSDIDKNRSDWELDKINRADKLIDDLQEIESIIRGVPIL